MFSTALILGLCDRVPLLISGLGFRETLSGQFFSICYDRYCFFERPQRQSPLAKLWHSHTGDSVGTIFFSICYGIYCFFERPLRQSPLARLWHSHTGDSVGTIFFSICYGIYCFFERPLRQSPLAWFRPGLRETLSGQFFFC